MASVVLPSINDARSSDFITKFDHSTPNFTRLQKIPNRNPNPNSTNFVTGNTSRNVIRTNHQPESSGYRYITFHITSYTKTELKGLKKRLISDLEQVRILRQFVCSTPIRKTNHNAPELEVQTVPVEIPVASFNGQKRTKPLLQPVRDAKKRCGRVSNAQKRKVMMTECSQMLGKLMKHKNGWVFNRPVDAVAMKLYDYHNVISKPMDLGTIKSKLGRNEYDSPLAVALDVRLTFENAMLYNGKDSDVFVMAERLLLLFEDMFGSAYPKLVGNQTKTRNVPVVGETPVVSKNLDAELGKPMIRTANKREMTVEEKSELAKCFWNLQLGPDGMNQIMAIVKKGAGLGREGGEIELDLAVLDNETLWTLHSFIGSAVRKEAAATCNMVSSVQTDNVEEQFRERDAGEEYVDIGEEMQLTNFPSVEIEKDGLNGSGGSDSSSDSDSSSSDSGSGTSYNEEQVNSTQKGVVP